MLTKSNYTFFILTSILLASCRCSDYTQSNRSVQNKHHFIAENKGISFSDNHGNVATLYSGKIQCNTEDGEHNIHDCIEYVDEWCAQSFVVSDMEPFRLDYSLALNYLGDVHFYFTESYFKEDYVPLEVLDSMVVSGVTYYDVIHILPVPREEIPTLEHFYYADHVGAIQYEFVNDETWSRLP